MKIGDCEFRRGFVEKIAIAPQVLADRGADLLARFPIRELQLLPFGWDVVGSSAVDATIRQLTDAVWFSRITSLDLSQSNLHESALYTLLCSSKLGRLASLSIQRTASACQVLAMAPFLARLRRLRLAADRQRSSTWESAQLLGSGVFASLVHLELNGSPRPRELEALAKSLPPRLESLAIVNGWSDLGQILGPLGGVRIPGLLKLDLSRNSLDPRVALSLSRSVFLESVEDLDLSGNRLGDEGVSLLARTPHFACLRRLNLGSNSFGPAGCQALAAATLPSLQALHLRTNRIGDEGLRWLVRSRELRGLKALHVGYNRITSLGALALAEAFPPWLEVLDLSWNQIGDTGAIALASGSEAPRLAALDLSYCELGDAAAQAMADSSLLENLHTLNLGTNQIGDTGLSALAGSPYLRRLESLNLGNSAVTDAGAGTLMESPLFRRLVALHLPGTAISSARQQLLRREFRGILG
jgi:Ran GTPase-activating protein (RanGAP) involved in mRNA processing and transport